MTKETSRPERLILLTNDDGVQASGLSCIRSALAEIGKVVVVAPLEERSGASHSLTIHQPVRISSQREDVFAVTGTPVDCIIFAFRKILPRLPDLVVSGINHGPNLGDDILYSGTVAAAREAALYGVPSMAVSTVGPGRAVLEKAAQFALRLMDDIGLDTFPPGLFLNVNVPDGGRLEYRFTRQGSKRADSAVEEKKDPRGRSYYWIGTDLSEWRVETDTDYEAIQDGYISVTPLQRDQTNYKALESLLDSQSHRPDSKVITG